MDEYESAHILGEQIDSTRFNATLNEGLLLKLVGDPRKTEDKALVNADIRLRELQEVREDVQRGFTGAKEENVGSFSDYIEGMKLGTLDGITPTITLYSLTPLDVDLDRRVIMIPWDHPIVAIDGETQLAARHEVRSRLAAWKPDKVPVMICHNKPIAWARQAFYDLNNLAVRQKPALSVTRDSRSPINAISRKVEQEVTWLHGRVSYRDEKLKSKSTELVTFLNLRTFLAILLHGPAATKYASKDVPVKSEVAPKLERTAVAYLNALNNAFPAACSDVETQVLLNPTVFGAVGAMATSLVHVENGQLEAGVSETIAKLRDVSWNNGPTWGKVTGRMDAKRTKVIFGGVKQALHSVYGALNNPRKATYYHVRMKEVPPDVTAQEEMEQRAKSETAEAAK